MDFADFTDFGEVATPKLRPPTDLGVIRAASKSCSDFFLTLERFAVGRSFSERVLRTSSGNLSENDGLFFLSGLALSSLANGCNVTRLGLRFGREPMPVSRQGMELERDFSKLTIWLCQFGLRREGK